MYLCLKLCPCFPTIQVNLNNQVYLRKKPLQTQGSQKIYKSQELSMVICSQKQLTEIIFENTLNYNPFFYKIFCSKPLKKIQAFWMFTVSIQMQTKISCISIRSTQFTARNCLGQVLYLFHSVLRHIMVWFCREEIKGEGRPPEHHTVRISDWRYQREARSLLISL